MERTVNLNLIAMDIEKNIEFTVEGRTRLDEVS